MFKHCCVLLLVTISCSYLPILSNSLTLKSHRESEESTFRHLTFNEALVTLLKKCNLGFRKMIVYDNYKNSSSFDTLSIPQLPIAVSLMSGPKNIDTMEQLYNVENQAFLILTNPEDEKFLMLSIKLLLNWQSYKNCTVIIIPKPDDDCLKAKYTLFFMGQLSIATAYYICGKKKLSIYTYDMHGDTKPSHWVRTSQALNRHNNLTFYGRYFRKADICQGFLFNRTRIIDNDNYILIGLSKANFPKWSWPYLREDDFDEKIEKLMHISQQQDIDALRRLLKVKFAYYFGDLTDGPLGTPTYFFTMYRIQFVDLVLIATLYQPDEILGNNFFPTYYDHYVIVSHNRGLKTPLEKIGSFYGSVTLISLIIFLVLSFIVIWFKTRKNIAFAAFDILRLLTNGAINVPIDTLSLKVFFCMIFLYFLVIQATFSGHLAEFLTIPQLKKNVESLEDLKDPQIKIIYSIGYSYDERDLEILKEKIIPSYDIYSCLDLAAENSNSVCVGLFKHAQRYVAIKDKDSKLHISQKFSPTRSSYTCRKQFLLREQFNKALMFLTETKIFSHIDDDEKVVVESILARREVASKVAFRVITFKDLKFAFIFLIIGNSLGLVCFVIEIFVGRNNKAGTRMKRQKIIKFGNRKNKKIKIQPIRITVRPRQV